MGSLPTGKRHPPLAKPVHGSHVVPACSCSPCWACSLCGVVQRAKQLLPGSNPWPEVPIGVCVAGDSEQSVFRHERRMKLVELSGRTTGRLGYTRRPEPTPSEGRQRWHNDTLSSPHLPPDPFTISDYYWPDGAVGAWAPPLLPPGPQDLPRDYGPEGAAGGLSRSTPRRADDTTTRPQASGAGRRVTESLAVRCPGLGARLLATSDEARAGWYIARLYSGSF